MPRVGVILGSSATGPRAALAEAVAALGAVAIQRHAGEGYTLPHRIAHATNVRSLLAEGCDVAIGVCSVGSLREDLGVGELLCPDDFIALTDTTTALEGVEAHRPPGFHSEWRTRLAAAGAGLGVRDGGVYWQANGPRFETPAEIHMIAAHADVVGMTMASECVVAGELGLPYAAVCAVDNLANGIGPGPLCVPEMEAVRDRNAARLRELLEAVLPALAEERL
jgi:5'-methylthioadenosine phosphorylase